MRLTVLGGVFYRCDVEMRDATRRSTHARPTKTETPHRDVGKTEMKNRHIPYLSSGVSRVALAYRRRTYDRLLENNIL